MAEINNFFVYSFTVNESSPAESRDETVCCKLKRTEKEELKIYADNNNLTLSGAARQCILTVLVEGAGDNNGKRKEKRNVHRTSKRDGV